MAIAGFRFVTLGSGCGDRLPLVVYSCESVPSVL